MIRPFLRVSLCIGIAVYFFLIGHFLKSKALNLKYSLLWIISGIIMLILVIFPGILYEISALLGFASPVSAIISSELFFLMCILMSVTSIVSKQNEKSKRLTQDLALLEKRVRELEREKEKHNGERQQ